MCVHFFVCSVKKCDRWERGQVNQCENLCLICLKSCLFFLPNVLKPVGFIFNLLCILSCFLSLPLSVKFTWKLNTGIGTQLCYLVPLAICWLLKKKCYRPLSNTFESPARPLSVLRSLHFTGSVKDKKSFTKASMFSFCLQNYQCVVVWKILMAQYKVHLLCLEEGQQHESTFVELIHN